MTAARVKIACINWGYDDAPKALVYVLDGDEMRGERYCQTWADAVTAAQRMAAYIKATS